MFENNVIEVFIFKHKDQLSALVTPHKRGMETKGRTTTESVSTDFDPMLDPSNMSPKQREEWFVDYQKATSQTKGIYTDSNGKKTII